jgi:hypothetical protein
MALSRNHLLSPLGALLALAFLWPVQAWAETLIVEPTGNAKERNIEKVSRSLHERVGGTAGLIMSEIEIGAECAIDPACLASAGRGDGVSKVVGVHVSRDLTGFTVTLLAVDAATGAELARHEMTGVKRKKLEELTGPRIIEFAQAIPDPVVEEPVVEEPVAEEPATEEPVVEEPVVEEPIVEEPVAEEPVVEEPVSDPIPLAVEEPADDSSYKVELGLGTGVLFPQVSSELGTSAGLEFDVGVPVWKSLSVVSAIGYAQPTVEGKMSDPRLADSMYSTDTTQRELTWTLGATWRFLKASSRLNAYGGLGGRIFLLETLTNGSAGGTSFGENRETSTRIGAAAWGGAEYLIGPGAAVAELDFGGSDLPHLVTGDVSTTAVAIQVGYRLRL